MIHVHAIPAFNDNYIWVFYENPNQAYIVDPGCSKTVIDYLSQYQITPVGLLITHHHRDHTGGINHLVEYYKKSNNTVLAVYGPEKDNIDGLTHNLAIKDHQIISLSLPGITGKVVVMSIPGHTLGHIAYKIQDNLFCGDTLFSAGCGRLFEGTPVQMLNSLALLSDLDNDTYVFCAHEYTQSNLCFASEVLPHDPMVIDYTNKVDNLRKNNQITLPSTIGLEKNINPFFRVKDVKLIKLLEKKFNVEINDKYQCFAILRQYKDIF